MNRSGRYSVEIGQDIMKIQERKQKYDYNYPIYSKMMEQCLEREEYGELIELFQKKEVVEIAQMNTTLAILNLAVNIYQMEQEEGIQHKILDGFHTLKEVEEAFLKVKFLLWKLEFTDEEQQFIDYVIEQQISIPYLKYLIHTSAFHKEGAVKIIAMQFKKKGSFAKAFGMLNYLNELSSNEEFVYCEMADICIQLQQYQKAADCIGRIQRPTELLAEYERKWGI